jgi:toxin YoeB
MKVSFTEVGFTEYIRWQTEDKRTLKKINALIADIQRNGFESGIGKPEKLRYRPGWSRKIDEKNRLTYESDPNGNLIITSCIGHYEDK